ncbi:hypothetical protein CJF30_00003673 [Rutstroemia sp. NJR-2017a BBW]|nr:hypothetical protein CJF30_00003673 [Rutstroemia sp. NJR-2017a BBW]
MSFNHRKFSMNRSTGAPRLSTNRNRRFSTHEPSANGLSLYFPSKAFSSQHKRRLQPFSLANSSKAEQLQKGIAHLYLAC